MWGSREPDLPDDARIVLVLASASAGDEACAALAARGDRVLHVGYGDGTVEEFRAALEERDDPPPVRSLGVGSEVEPTDLTGQGIAIAETLTSGTAVRLDALEGLLEQVDGEPVFRFVHSLSERCASSSAVMVVRLDPSAAEPRTVAALSTLMDAVVRVDEDTVEVRPELTEKD